MHHHPTQENRRRANLQLEREAEKGHCCRGCSLRAGGGGQAQGHVLAQLLPRGERETLSLKVHRFFQALEGGLARGSLIRR